MDSISSPPYAFSGSQPFSVMGQGRSWPIKQLLAYKYIAGNYQQFANRPGYLIVNLNGYDGNNTNISHTMKLSLVLTLLFSSDDQVD